MEKNEFFGKIDMAFDAYLDVGCEDEKKEKLYHFMQQLIEKNKVMNLTAITEPDMIIMKHFVDSLEILKKRDLVKEGLKIADVGTGAGFPGLPIAIMCPDVDFLLCDSLQKRINFLDEVVKNIGLSNVKLSHIRAEDVRPKTEFREKFDVVVSRGVSKVATLAEYLFPFAKVGGKVVMYKMDDCGEELSEGQKAVDLLGGSFLEKVSYELTDGEPKRCMLVFDKIKGTLDEYPRQGNKPRLKPIV